MVNLLQMAIVFALVLGAMVVIHEFGHFIVAKLFGVRVEVFSVGFGKRLWGFRRGGTDYRLSLIPLGGYVKMAGENLDEQVTGAPDEFMSKPKWQRFLVAIAGPAMNIITALMIPATLAMIHHSQDAYIYQPPVISTVQAGSAAEKAGLQRGDEIIRIDGIENPTWRDVEDQITIKPDQNIQLTVRRDGQTREVVLPVASQVIQQERIGDAGLEPYFGPNAKIVAQAVAPNSPAAEAGLKDGDQILAINGKPLQINLNPADPANRGDNAYYARWDVFRAIQSSNGQPITLTVKRGNETLDLQATPRLDGDVPKLGFAPVIADHERIVTRLSPGAALSYSWDLNMRILRLTFSAIGQIFTGQRSAGETLTGPVGIFRLTGQAAEQGAWSVFMLMSVLSLNLGIFNLLPIPVLDGGMIFMLILEAGLGLFGLTLTLKVKERMMQVGFVMLMLLMGFVIFNDISKMIPRGDSSPPAAEQQAPANK